MTYQQVYDLIKAALTERSQGTKVQVEDHEAAELALLQYIEETKGGFTGSVIREAHGSAVADTPCTLLWDIPFADSNYTFTVNAWEGDGNPVLVQFISRSSTKIVVQTMVNCNLYAIAKPYQPLQE